MIYTYEPSKNYGEYLNKNEAIKVKEYFEEALNYEEFKELENFLTKKGLKFEDFIKNKVIDLSGITSLNINTQIKIIEYINFHHLSINKNTTFGGQGEEYEISELLNLRNIPGNLDLRGPYHRIQIEAYLKQKKGFSNVEGKLLLDNNFDLSLSEYSNEENQIKIIKKIISGELDINGYFTFGGEFGEKLLELRKIPGALNLSESSLRTQINALLKQKRGDLQIKYGIIEKQDLRKDPMSDQMEFARRINSGEINASSEYTFGGENCEDLLRLKVIPGDLDLRGNNIRTQINAYLRFRRIDLILEGISRGKLLLDDDIFDFEILNNTNFQEFEKRFGKDITKIKDTEMREKAISILKNSYIYFLEEMKLNLKEMKLDKVDLGKIIINNTNITNEYKIKRIKEINNDFVRKKSKIESFGLKIEEIII